MNKLSSLVIFICVSVMLQAQNSIKEPGSFNLIKDKISSYQASSVKLNGYLGEKTNLVIEKRIKAQDADYLVEPFRHRNETRLWQTEFWGKWILSAIAAYNYTSDPDLLTTIKKAADGLLLTQTPDGYIGNYSVEAQLQQWDIWGRKYTMLGLLAFYDLSGDKRSLAGAKKLADHLMTQVGPGKTNIVTTGNYRGMPSSSILEPIVYLYRQTGEKKYLDFAQYIVDQWETENGPKLISKALAGIPVSERFPHPESWWSYENGQKAYEMMSCYEGLLELYRITGSKEYLDAVGNAVDNIIDQEINIAGSGSAFECFYKGVGYQDQPTYHTMETCVTMTWMKLCFNLLKLTEDPKYADQIEKSTYNALLASLKDDGTQIAKYSPLGGVRHAGEEQCGMHINCCNANGPRAFMMLPRFAVMGGNNEIFINLYGDSHVQIPLSGKNKVNIDQISDYPVSDIIEINVNPEKPEIFTVAIRIPAWSLKTEVRINGESVNNLTAGTYLRLKRVWNKYDKITMKMDMRGRIVSLGSSHAILRGPVVLARDSRFDDGFINESAVMGDGKETIELIQSKNKPMGVWMAFTAPAILGTDLEGEYRNPRQISFCDFASAGNTWSEESRYKVWIPATLNVMKREYKSY
ncbi:MAG TPA: beta-L-arabinofuranosidase domain-containing protein [Bacteroidales bacterium]|nr:beta-L-arabinofuranosidase domain-containing protein [Bacteroidales bacterium]